MNCIISKIPGIQQYNIKIDFVFKFEEHYLNKPLS